MDSYPMEIFINPNIENLSICIQMNGGNQHIYICPNETCGDTISFQNIKRSGFMVSGYICETCDSVIEFRPYLNEIEIIGISHWDG
jgi:hypothetical protein